MKNTTILIPQIIRLYPRSHFKSIAKKICKDFKIKKSSFIVEAGSNELMEPF